MKEKEFREKMAGLYGPVPMDTHEAFEHALTHHREQEEVRTVRVSKMRIAVVLTLVLMLLTTGAYAVYARYSVKDYRKNLSQEFLNHVITLDESYKNDLFSMTVNDLVFDGSTVEVAMNIIRNNPDIAYFMRTKVTATCAGKDYMVDVEGMRGLDFLGGSMWPEFDYYDDPVAAEQQGFGFSGVLWDEEGNPPPAGEPIDWTMTFTVLKPLYEIVVDNDVMVEGFYDKLGERCVEAWKNKQIFMYSGDAVSYVYYVQEHEGIDWDLPLEEVMTATGAFELADVITFHFTTNFDDHVIKEELIGQRYDIGEFDLVLDNVSVSFQRVNITMHVEADHMMSETEIWEKMPNTLSVVCRNAAGEVVYQSKNAGMGHGVYMLGVPEGYYGLGIDFYHEADDIASMTFQGNNRDYETGEIETVEGFEFTVDLTGAAADQADAEEDRIYGVGTEEGEEQGISFSVTLGN